MIISFNISFENAPIAIVEICIPESYYYILTAQDIRIINEKDELQLYLNARSFPFEKKTIAATRHEIVICNSVDLFIYDFALSLKKAIKVTDGKSFFVKEIRYNPDENIVYLATDINEVLVMNDQYEIISNFTIPMYKQLFSLGYDGFIYYADSQSRLLQYDSNNISFIGSPCKIISWYIVDSNGIILSNCFRKVAHKVLYFHTPNGTILNELDFDISPIAFLDSKSNIVVALYDQVLIFY